MSLLTQAAKSIGRRSMSLAHTVQRLAIHRGRLSVLVAALIAAVCLTACGPSSSNDPPLPPGTESTGLYTPPADPYAPSDETTTLTRRPTKRRQTPIRRPAKRITAPMPETLFAPTRQSRFHRQILATGRRVYTEFQSQDKRIRTTHPHIERTAPCLAWILSRNETASISAIPPGTRSCPGRP